MKMESREREKKKKKGLCLTCSRTGEVTVSQALKRRVPVHTISINVPTRFIVVVDWIGDANDANDTAVINRSIQPGQLRGTVREGGLD